MLDRPPSSAPVLGRPRLGGLFALLAVGAALGCATEVVKRSPGLPEEPSPTLWATYQVETVRTDSGGGLALTGGQVAKLGQAAEERVREALAEAGFALQMAPEKAKVLDKAALMRPSNKLTSLTGVWTHPDTSSYRFDHITRGSDEKVAEALAAADEGRPYFASVTLFVDEAKGFPVDRAPLIKVSVRVIDREGTPAYVARTEGAGREVAIAADRSLPNLLQGLDVALDKLRTLTPQDL